MRTISIEKVIYNFNELSEKAKMNAIYEYNDVSCHSDWIETLSAFCDTFNVKLYSYNIDEYDFSYNFEIEDYYFNLGGYRLSKWLNNNDIYKYKYDNKYHNIDFMIDNCGLTGFCGDYDALLPIVETKNYKRKYENYYNMIEDCLKSIFNAWREEIKYQLTEEYFAELAEINEWEFDENGNMI